MQIADGYEMLSLSTRQAIINEQNYRLGSEDNTDVVQRLLDPAYVKRLWGVLQTQEQAACRLFLLRAPQGFFSKRQWERLIQSNATQLSLGLTGLRRVGFILTVRKMWSDIGYIIPQELREILFQHVLQSSGLPPETRLPDKPLPYYTTAGRGLHLDLFAFLLYVSQFEVKLTQRRTIHRRLLQKLSAVLSLQAEHVEALYEEFFPSEVKNVYQSADAVVMDLALRMQLIRIGPKQLELVEPAVEHWLQMDSRAQTWMLWQQMTLLYVTRWPWLEAFALAMKQVHQSSWVSVTAMVKELDAQGFELPEMAEEIITRQWLHPLLGFGWIQLGREHDQELYWRWTPLYLQPEENAHWYVEPTGEVICPAAVPLRKLWSLRQWGTIHFEGELICCRLSSEHVQKYAAAGGSVEEITNLLQDNCPYPLPDTVCEMIRRWIAEARQIRIERWSRIRLLNPCLLQELIQIPSLQSFHYEQISETELLLPVEQEEKFLQVLRQCGYEPQLQVAQPSSSEEDIDPIQSTAAGLVSSSTSWDGYKVENVFPDRLEGVPQLAKLPKMWTNHYQSYHPQTLRDLFKRAQELQLPVQLETVGEIEWEGMLQKVEVEMGFWYITLEVNRKKEKIKVEDVRRVRLLLPQYV